MPTSLAESFVAGQAPGLSWGNTVASWINDQSTRWYNVLEYGAVGDGSTDATTAIQNAIDAAYAASGGVVYFPAGRYKVSSTLTLKFRVSLLGYTPTFANATVLGRAVIEVASGMSTPVIINDRTNGPIQQGIQHWQFSFIQGMALDLNGSTTGCYALDIQECWGLNVDNCHIVRPYDHGVYLYSCNDIYFRNNAVLVFTAGVSTANCLHIEDIADSVFSGNQFGGSSGSAVYITKKGSGVNNRTWLFKFHDNLCYNSLAGSGIEVKDCTDSIGINITGNRCDQNYLNGITINNSPENLIANNVCAMNGWGNVTGQAGIYVVTSADTVLSANVCSEGTSTGGAPNQDYGIDVGANCDYSTLVGNSVRNNDTAGIRISATGNDNVRAQGNPGFADQ